MHREALLGLANLEYRRGLYESELAQVTRVLQLDACDAEANFVAGNRFRQGVGGGLVLVDGTLLEEPRDPLHLTTRRPDDERLHRVVGRHSVDDLITRTDNAYHAGIEEM